MNTLGFASKTYSNGRYKFMQPGAQCWNFALMFEIPLILDISYKGVWDSPTDFLYMITCASCVRPWHVTPNGRPLLAFGHAMFTIL